MSAPPPPHIPAPDRAGSGCDTKMQHILFLTSHFSTRMCRIFPSHSHCLLFYLGLCDGHLQPPPVLPPSTHSLKSSAPFCCGQQPSPWGLSYQREPSLHITQLTRQQPEPVSFRGASAQTTSNTSRILYLWLAGLGATSPPLKCSLMTVAFKRLHQTMGALLTGHSNKLDNDFLCSVGVTLHL